MLRHGVFEQSMTVAFGQALGGRWGRYENMKCKQLLAAANRYQTIPDQRKLYQTLPNHNMCMNMKCKQLPIVMHVQDMKFIRCEMFTVAGV